MKISIKWYLLSKSYPKLLWVLENRNIPYSMNQTIEIVKIIPKHHRNYTFIWFWYTKIGIQKEPNQFFVMRYHVQIMGVTSDNNSLKMSLFYRVLNIATEEKVTQSI